MIRTNIMLTPQQHAYLKNQAVRQHRTLGELVRDAVNSTYPPDSVMRRRQIALEAYQEGFISLGKLAEALGLDPISARDYLRERNMRLMTQDEAELAADAANA
jgi:phage terminase small subunit